MFPPCTRSSLHHRRVLSPSIVILLVAGLSGAATAAAPRVDYVVPGHGPTGGGTQVVVVGDGFVAGATLTIGGVAATGVSVIDARTILAETGAAGSARRGLVEVANPDTSRGDLANGFSYITDVYYVDQAAGDDANPGTSPSQAKRTIQAALDVYQGASSSDPPIEVRVAEGEYDENLVVFSNQTLTGGWRSGFTERDADRYLTVIDGGTRSFVARSWGLGVSPTLDGFTLVNGERGGFGGGAFYSTDDPATLSNCVLVGNRTGGSGGAVYGWFNDDASVMTVRSSVIVANRADGRGGGAHFSFYGTVFYPLARVPSPLVDDNVIVGNRADDGGGLSIGYVDWELEPRVRGNRLVGNGARGDGGGASIESPFVDLVAIEMTNNLLDGNTADGNGGGLHIAGSGSVDMALRSNTLVSNSSPLDAGSQLYVSAATSATGSLASGIVRGGTSPLELGATITVDYSNVEGGYPGTGNSDADPLFVSGPLGSRYLSQTATGEPGQPFDSPALDAGDPSAAAAEGVLRWIDESGATPVVADRTTRTDNAPDAGVIDQGYHWPTRPVPVRVAPSLLRADPAVFSFHGDEWVVLRGEGFERRSLVRFGGVDAQETVLASPHVLVVRPAAMERGPTSVEVRNPGTDGIPGTTDDPVATLGGLTAGDTDPPRWSVTAGTPIVEDLGECSPAIGVRWEEAWDADSPPVTFEVYRAVDAPAYEETTPDARVAEGIPVLWWVDTDVSELEEYSYVVQARDSSEQPRRDLNGWWVPEFGLTPTLDPGDTDPPPSVGENLRVSSPDNGTTVELRWEPVYPALRYRVYRSTDPAAVIGPGNEAGVAEGQHNGVFSEAPPDDPIVYYLVTAEDGCGNESS